MEMTPEIKSLLLDPVTIAIIVGSFVGWILSVGLSMKWALALTADETPTLRRATFIAFFIAFAQMFAMMFISMLVPGQFRFLANIGLFFLNLKILAIFADIGMMRAFVTNIAYGVISIVLFVALGFGMMFAFNKGVAEKHAVALEQIEEIVQTKNIELAAGRSGTLEESSDVSESDSGIGSIDDLRNVFFSSSDDVASDQPGEASADDGGWFGSSVSNTVTPTETSQQTSTFHPGRNLDTGMPFQAQPLLDTSNQQGNPFVK